MFRNLLEVRAEHNDYCITKAVNVNYFYLANQTCFTAYWPIGYNDQTNIPKLSKELFILYVI